MTIIGIFVALFIGLGVSSVAGRSGYIDPIMLTGDGISDPLIKAEAAEFIQACERRGVMEPCELGVGFITRGEFWHEDAFNTLPGSDGAAGITYSSFVTPFKNIFIQAHLQYALTDRALKNLIWHELAHAVFQAEHDDLSPHLMNSGFGIYELEKERMSWDILEEHLFRNYGFPNTQKLKFHCNLNDLRALGTLLIAGYCTNP